MKSAYQTLLEFRHKTGISDPKVDGFVRLNHNFHESAFLDIWERTTTPWHGSTSMSIDEYNQWLEGWFDELAESVIVDSPRGHGVMSGISAYD